ncbi:aminoglycoside phosphotransferase family protein [Microlunatus soli]|uniref:Phosphotransferase enzyme family protein n=1 Tax=Microlunatus soli TaxID=630515 RepID=A0A1H1PB22_9ACTN|nr:aminoglycoside phosphotransferase family protein [Microlunatus soli]SDS08488.1 Phosphotransferase enzyme family protein [Microlunatus soli]
MSAGPPPPAEWKLSDLRPLEGGVSGATVLRGLSAGRPVVAKYTDRCERDVLRLLADLDEPLFPRLLDSHGEGDPLWIMINYHTGAAAGIAAGLTEQVHAAVGRMHGRFVGRRAELPADIELIDRDFLRRMLTSFGPEQLIKARDLLGERLVGRASALMRRLAADPRFMNAGELFPSTLLHGDLYGLNVLLPGPGDPLPLVIDWNTARYGPAMFDVAMTAPYDSEARRAAGDGWTAVTGHRPAPAREELSHAWCSTMLNLGYSGVVAWRSSAADAEQMIIEAERGADRFATLLSRLDR